MATPSGTVDTATNILSGQVRPEWVIEPFDREIPKILSPEVRVAAIASRDEQTKVEQLQRIAEARINEIRGNPRLSEEERRNLIGKLEAAKTGGNAGEIAQALAVAITTVAIEEKVEEVDGEVGEAIAATAVGKRYGLSGVELRRVRMLSRKIDLGDTKAVEAHVEQLLGDEVPKEARQQLAADGAAMLKAHPQAVAQWNAASTEARMEVMGAYVATQRDMKALEKDTHLSEATRRTIKTADHLGLESDSRMRALIGGLKEHTLSEEAFVEQSQNLIKEQEAKIEKEMDAAVKVLPEALQHALQGMDAGKISHAALGAFDHLNKVHGKFEKLSTKEQAALRAFSASKTAVIMETLGSEALSPELAQKLERGAGTLAERTQAAMEVLKEHMPPELANFASKRPDLLKLKVEETLEALDARGVAVRNAETVLAQTDQFKQVASCVDTGVMEEMQCRGYFAETPAPAPAPAEPKPDMAALLSGVQLSGAVSGGTDMAFANGWPPAGQTPAAARPVEPGVQLT